MRIGSLVGLSVTSILLCAACGNSDDSPVGFTTKDSGTGGTGTVTGTHDAGGSSTGTPTGGGGTSHDAGADATTSDAGPTGSTSVLDGTWNVTTLPSLFFNASFASGKIVAGKGTYTMTLLAPDVGQTDPNDSTCTISMDQTVVTVTLTGNKGTGTVVSTFADSGDTCDEVGAFTNTLNLTITQTTARTPTTTPYDGDWRIVISDGNDDNGDDDDDDDDDASVDAGPVGPSMTVSIDGTNWKTSANDPDDNFVFTGNGSIANGMATGTDGMSDFAAQKQ